MKLSKPEANKKIKIIISRPIGTIGDFQDVTSEFSGTIGKNQDVIWRDRIAKVGAG